MRNLHLRVQLQQRGQDLQGCDALEALLPSSWFHNPSGNLFHALALLRPALVLGVVEVHHLCVSKRQSNHVCTNNQQNKTLACEMQLKKPLKSCM